MQVTEPSGSEVMLRQRSFDIEPWAVRETGFEREVGVELLVETARLWMSIGQHAPDGGVRIDGVTARRVANPSPAASTMDVSDRLLTATHTT
jgi:hypothetical protein